MDNEKSKTHERDGIAWQNAERQKEIRTYADVAGYGRCHLFTCGMEVGARWAPEFHQLVSLLAKAEARSTVMKNKLQYSINYVAN